MFERDVVLPESLVAELIGKVGDIADKMDEAFTKLGNQREELRRAMLANGHIVSENIDANSESGLLGLAVDGASIVEIDRATSYGISCVTRVGPSQSYSAFESNMFVLPHLANVDGLASGFMMMQEIMMAVETAQKYPESVVFIDGSKITFIIKINQFYSAFRDENKKDHLDVWRSGRNTSEAGLVLQKFEAKNWFADLLGLPNIVGILKLVTTDVFIEKYLPQFKGRFDDKILAALVLERGERTKTVYLKNPEAERRAASGQPHADVAPFHINEYYKYADEFDIISRVMTTKGSAHRVSHSYFNAPQNGAIYKLEITEALGADGLTKALAWISEQSSAPDMLEPYSMFVADRFVKEAVSLSKDAIAEITRIRIRTEWAWNFTGPYRSA